MLGVSYSFHCLGHPHPFFFRLALNAFPDFGSVSRIKKKIKKIIRSLEIGGPGTQG